MLPNFLVIGAMRAGTTSLYQYVRRHPHVFMPAMKEPQFFASNWGCGQDWYESLFDGAGDAVAVGEASTEYTKHPYFPGVPARVRRLLPDVRMIYLVRDPIERMISDYRFRSISREGWERDPSIESALLGRRSYCDFSRYAMQIERYLEHFPPERLMVVRSEELKERPDLVLARVFAFLGVDTGWRPPDLARHFHESSGDRYERSIGGALRKIPGHRAITWITPRSLKRRMNGVATRPAPPKPVLPDAVVHELHDRLRDDVHRLRRYMGDDFDGWGIA